MNQTKNQARYYKENRIRFMAESLAYKRKINRSSFYTDLVVPLVMQRDKNECVECGSKNNLIVHHKHYDVDKLTHDDLVTLCRSCHKIKHKEIR